MPLWMIKSKNLLEIVKKIVREVTWGYRHYLDNSADRKAQISPMSEMNVLPMLRFDLQIFLGSVYHSMYAQSPFLFQLGFGISLIPVR